MSPTRVALAILLLVLPAPLRAQAADPELRALIVTYERALVDMLNGEPAAWKAMLSPGADVTLFTPFGAVRAGQADVVRQYEFAASRLAPGSGKATVEYLATHREGNLATLVVLERSSFKMRDGQARDDGYVRGTMVFRREEGAWRLVHRHMDHLREQPPSPTK